MRETKFRGKRYGRGGEWVYGYYFYDDIHKKHFILTMDIVGNIRESPVIPESVGQYTGTTDKTGKEIYERDIVQDNGNRYRDPKTIEIKYGVMYNCGDCTDDSGVGFNFHMLQPDQVEVIGNTIDNPELTK